MISCPFSFDVSSSAPASIAASNIASALAFAASYSTTPTRLNMKATAPVSARLPPLLVKVARALEGKFGEPRKSGLVWRPQNSVPVPDEEGEKILRLIETLEDNDDVQNVYANFEVSDSLMAKMSA